MKKELPIEDKIVLTALGESKHDFRTAKGLAKELKMEEDIVLFILEKPEHQNYIKKAESLKFDGERVGGKGTVFKFSPIAFMIWRS